MAAEWSKWEQWKNVDNHAPNTWRIRYVDFKGISTARRGFQQLTYQYKSMHLSADFWATLTQSWLGHPAANARDGSTDPTARDPKAGGEVIAKHRNVGQGGRFPDEVQPSLLSPAATDTMVAPSRRMTTASHRSASRDAPPILSAMRFVNDTIARVERSRYPLTPDTPGLEDASIVGYSKGEVEDILRDWRSLWDMLELDDMVNELASLVSFEMMDELIRPVSERKRGVLEISS